MLNPPEHQAKADVMCPDTQVRPRPGRRECRLQRESDTSRWWCSMASGMPVDSLEHFLIVFEPGDDVFPPGFVQVRVHHRQTLQGIIGGGRKLAPPEDCFSVAVAGGDCMFGGADGWVPEMGTPLISTVSMTGRLWAALPLPTGSRTAGSPKMT